MQIPPRYTSKPTSSHRRHRDKPDMSVCAGWPHPACDPVPLSLHILALCLNCIRGLCWPMPLSSVKIKLDGLKSKPIFCQCQPRVLLVVLSQRYLFPVVMQQMRACCDRESTVEMNSGTSSVGRLLLLSVCNYMSSWLKTFTGPHLNPWWQTAIIMQIHKHCASEVDVLDYTGQAQRVGSTKRSTVLHDEAQQRLQNREHEGLVLQPIRSPRLLHYRWAVMPIHSGQYCELWCHVKKPKCQIPTWTTFQISPWCLFYEFKWSVFWQFDSQKPAICLELSASVQQELLTELRKKNLINWCCK